MKKSTKLISAISLFSVFALWTVFVLTVDVKEIGPNHSSVGLSSLNNVFFDMIEYNEVLFKITDYLMYTVILAAAVFGAIGLFQWIKRKSFLKVDHQILLLGASYIVIIAAYFIFNYLPINYRPVLIEGKLELSYPSSHTMTALFVFLSAIPMVNYLIKNKTLKTILNVFLCVLAAFTIIGRFLSGAHWFSDILGGCFFASAMLLLFMYFIDFVSDKKNNKINEQNETKTLD